MMKKIRKLSYIPIPIILIQLVVFFLFVTIKMPVLIWKFSDYNNYDKLKSAACNLG